MKKNIAFILTISTSIGCGAKTARATEVIPAGNTTNYKLNVLKDIEILKPVYIYDNFRSLGLSKAGTCGKDLNCVKNELFNGECVAALRPSEDNGDRSYFGVVHPSSVNLKLSADVVVRTPVEESEARPSYVPHMSAFSVHMLYKDKNKQDKDVLINDPVWANKLEQQFYHKATSQFDGYVDAISKTNGPTAFPEFAYKFTNDDFAYQGEHIVSGPSEVRFAICNQGAGFLAITEADVLVMQDQ